MLLAAAQLVNQTSFFRQIKYSNQIVDLSTYFVVRHIVETAEIGEMLFDCEVEYKGRLTVWKRKKIRSQTVQQNIDQFAIKKTKNFDLQNLLHTFAADNRHPNRSHRNALRKRHSRTP